MRAPRAAEWAGRGRADRHLAYCKGSETFDKVVAEFGAGVVDAASGEIDRRALGPIVFGDLAKLQALNGIVWPAIRALALAELRAMRARGVDACVMEAAVLLEAGWDDFVDELWVVVVPEDVACARLAARNALAPEAALQRIRAQMTNEVIVPALPGPSARALARRRLSGAARCRLGRPGRTCCCRTSGARRRL